MKPVTRVLDVNSTLGGEKVGMTIDHSALAHIMSVLTDLYSDPELAVIREYSTNALDSHIEAGQARPVEITLPSPLSPFLRIRDYGVGMDADGIRDTYSRYGTSTKRGSDDVVGMLGLGCKSALTYTDQFTLTGIKDGRMIQVSIGRDEDGSGSMSIVADHETDDLPGVEVIIPAKRGNSFEGKALEFFRFWTPGTVLVNGEQPKRIDGQWITDSIVITTEVDSDYVVMGNVAYPVRDSALSTGDARRAYYRQDYTVAFVPIGAVQFTPSREDLQMTKLTKETLAALKVERDSKLDAALQANIAAADTPFEAILTWQQAKQIGLSGGATYRGRELRDELWRTRPDGNRYEESYLVTTPQKHSRFRLTGTWQSTIQVETAHNLYFEMFDGQTLTNVKRAKLMQYLDKNPNDAARWVFVRGRLPKDERFWLEGATIIDWAVVDAEKLPRDAVTKKVGPRGAYKGRMADGTWDKPIMAEKIDTSKPIVYHHGNRWSFQYGFESKHGMIPEDVLVVCLEANRIEKFKRDFPTAQSVTQYAAAYVKKQIAQWDATKLKAAKFQQMSGVGLLKQLPADRITDPNIKEGITLAGINADAIKEKLVYWSHHAPEVEVTNPLDKYPLLRYTRSITDAVEIDHAVTYINAAFAADRS